MEISILACFIAMSGSFKPCPVRTHTTSSPGNLFSFKSFFTPAHEAAEAGSTNTPSFEANSFWASNISSSETVSIKPEDSLTAFIALSQLAGFPIFYSPVAIV